MTLRGCFFGIIKYTIFFVSLMVVGALSTFLTLRFFTSGDEVVVPDLTGKQPVEAIQILNQQGLQLKILPQKRYSDSVAKDRILLQDPRASVKIKSGRSITVYLSLGPEKVIVPDLTGQSSRVATMMLEQHGLQVGKLIYVSSAAMEGDQVMAQYPLPGTEVSGVRTVNLLVNNLQTGPVYVMPDVIGRTYSIVNDYFKDAGLRVGLSQGVDYPGIASGTIVKQSPPAGYKVSKDTFISLYYSK
ncbi:MAG: hypothetical protein C5B54_07720 [Acidobacteria bacterium]|nr:MAG: hypothetical protein C5B54_07720 [Acidobacteriota bacterium]